MLRTFCHSKLHRASVTSIDLDYEGSLTIDAHLMNLAEIISGEQIHVLNINNGNRFVTYAIEGAPSSGIIQVNGSAAHLCSLGDKLIILTYCQIEGSQAVGWKPKVIQLDSNNEVKAA
ncbi:MAG: aspartate 1-decarboxylase [Candidatus Caenarcaniphilales bacterium]|nr:aspartate 1-decarboxylase [Candidatus Caenarcaniphilales bacterium]